MPHWLFKVKIKHLLTEKEDWESVMTSMTQIGNILECNVCFLAFKSKDRFKKIPHRDEFFGPVDYANKLLNELYDYADLHRIWIE